MFRGEIESLESTTPVVASARGRRRHLTPSSASRARVIPPLGRTRSGSRARRAGRIAWNCSRRQHVEIAVDPSTLQVIGGRAAERSLMVAVRSLHAGLHAGRVGSLVVGLLGLWLVVESLTGLWLCWPSVRRRPRVIGVVPTEGFGSRGLRRLVGGASLVLGVVVALSGTVLALASVLAPPGAGVSPARTAGTRGRLDAIAMRAAATLPGARITAFIAADGGAIRVETTAGAMIVDRETGGVVREQGDQTRLTARDWITRLHYGDFAGWVSRVAYALVGLGLPVLSITGYLITARRTAGPS